MPEVVSSNPQQDSHERQQAEEKSIPISVSQKQQEFLRARDHALSSAAGQTSPEGAWDELCVAYALDLISDGELAFLRGLTANPLRLNEALERLRDETRNLARKHAQIQMLFSVAFTTSPSEIVDALSIAIADNAFTLRECVWLDELQREGRLSAAARKQLLELKLGDLT